MVRGIRSTSSIRRSVAQSAPTWRSVSMLPRTKPAILWSMITRRRRSKACTPPATWSAICTSSVSRSGMRPSQRLPFTMGCRGISAKPPQQEYCGHIDPPYLRVMPAQLTLFPQSRNLPEGFVYEIGFLAAEEEARLVKTIETLPFKQFEFQGFLGKRRVVPFGWKYDFNDRELRRTDNLPDSLLPLRERAAKLARVSASTLQQVLITEYQPGASI